MKTGWLWSGRDEINWFKTILFSCVENRPPFISLRWLNYLLCLLSLLTLNLFLPLARLEARTRRPLAVFILERKPCLFRLLRFDGWNVLFMVIFQFTEPEYCSYILQLWHFWQKFPFSVISFFFTSENGVQKYKFFLSPKTLTSDFSDFWCSGKFIWAKCLSMENSDFGNRFFFGGIVFIMEDGQVSWFQKTVLQTIC